MKSMWLLLLLLLTFNPAILLANEKPAKIVLHVNDAFKMGHLEKSVINIRNEMGADADIKVVVNGKAVTRMLRSNEDSSRIVQSILKQNVGIGLCHNAVSNNRVKKSMLIEGLEILETDGNVTVFNYQKQGYLYIKI